MSEQQDNNNSTEAATSEAAISSTAPDDTPATSTPEPEPVPVRRGSGAVAWLALLLGLALAVAAGWSVYEAQQREAVLLSRLHSLEDDSHPTAADGAAQVKLLEQRLQQRFAALEPKLSEQAQQLQQFNTRLRQLSEADNTDQLAARLDKHAQAMQQLQQELATQGETLDQFPAIDRNGWLLAEAEYLLRLANQRLIMTGDVASAQALLTSADQVLRELDDVSLHGVRRELASDIAALRAVPRVDVEGVYLRLGALLDQVGKLVIFELPQAAEQIAPQEEDNWQLRLQRGYEQALQKLSDYVIIRRRDVPVDALMDPQWEGLVRQNLQMLLEQSQVALLSGNQVLYRESLARAQHWVSQFFVSDEITAKAMDREIAELKAQAVSVELPDISAVVQALDEAISRRQQRGEGN